MSEIVPEGWRLNAIGECCNILDSQRIPLNSEERAVRQGDYPYYGANGIQGYIDDFIFEGDAILVAEDGGNFDQYQDRPIAQWVTDKYWVNNHAHILRAKDNDLNKWIYFSLVHKNILNFINGGTRAKLNQSDLREINILFPPLSEQKKIVSILTSVDQVIENIKSQISKLQNLKKAIINELLTKGIDHVEFKDSELGRIPKTWEVKSIGELFEVRGRIGWKGYTINDLRNDGPLVLGGTQVSKKHKIDLSKPVYVSEEKYLESPEIIIENKDIILVKTGNTIGKLALIGDDLGRATINPNTVILRSKSKTQDFIYQILTTKKYQDKFWEFVDVGAQPSLNQQNIKSIKVPLPPKFERDKLNRVLFAMDRLIEEKDKKVNQIQSLKKSLMQDLLTGIVRVKVN